MSIAKILVPVTGGPRDAPVLANAIAAARPFNAHVVAFFVRPDLSETLAFFTDGVSGVVVEEVVRATQDAGDEAAKRIDATIASACSAAGDRTRAPSGALRSRHALLARGAGQLRRSIDHRRASCRSHRLRSDARRRSGRVSRKPSSRCSSRPTSRCCARPTRRPRASRGASPSAGTARPPPRRR